MRNLARPHLVVLTGYPSSGKSTARSFLESELGFSSISSDRIRDEMWGQSYPELMREGTEGERKNAAVWDEILRKKNEYLLDKQDTVIDTTALDNYFRMALFDTRLTREIDIKSLKTLVYLEVDRSELTRRNIERGRKNDANSEWDERWQPPTQCGLYEIVTMQNTTPEDQQRMLQDL